MNPNLKVVLVAVRKVASDVARFVVRTLFLWMGAVGVGAVLLSYRYKVSEPELSSLLESVGVAVLVGGIVDGMFKSFESMGIFEKQLDGVKDMLTSHSANAKTMYDALLERVEKVHGEQLVDIKRMFDSHTVDLMYDPQSLVGRKDLLEIWRNVSRAMFPAMFPDITEQLEDIILETYFPAKSGYYYAKAFHNIVIELVDNAKDYIRTVETVRFDVKPTVGSSDEIVLPYAIEIEKDPGDEYTSWCLIFLKVNGVALENPPHTVQTGTNDEGKCVLKSCVTISLPGASHSTVEIKHEKKYSLRLNEQKFFATSRILSNLDVRINYGEGLRVGFYSTGTPMEFNDETIVNKREIWKKYESIIFANQGYRLNIERDRNVH